jgi:hypothetical protein
MSTLSLATLPTADPWWPITEVFRREPLFAGAALCLACLMLPTAFAMLLDKRTLLGVNIWVKPLKFEIALLVYLVTLAWFAAWLPKDVLASAGYRWFAIAVVGAIAAEMIWVGGAAAFGVGSHFNQATPFMGTIYGLMGLLAVLLTSASLVYGVVILRDPASPLDPAFRFAVGIGLILTFVLTVIVAGYMASHTGHTVGGNASDANGLPLMGWARDGGDLRVAHFFATHAMHVIPAFGLLVGLILPATAGTIAVGLFSTGYTLLVGYTFMQAIFGRPYWG